MELKVLDGDFKELVAEAVAKVLRESGLIAAIKYAAELQLAQEGLMTKEQVGDWLGVDERCIELWMRPASEPRGRGLPHIKIGTTVRFRLEALKRWALQHEVNQVISKAA
ncbi:MAG: hypothetical protein V4710_19080 [Verrucomicrobiota bacterium]